MFTKISTWLTIVSVCQYRDTHKIFWQWRMWENAQSIAEISHGWHGINYFEAEGEVAFYGPKLDIQEDCPGNEETLSQSTDFCFQNVWPLNTFGADGEEHFMIHCGLSQQWNALQLFLLKNYKGAFLNLVTPQQVTVVPVSNEAHRLCLGSC